MLARGIKKMEASCMRSWELPLGKIASLASRARQFSSVQFSASANFASVRPSLRLSRPAMHENERRRVEGLFLLLSSVLYAAKYDRVH